MKLFTIVSITVAIFALAPNAIAQSPSPEADFYVSPRGNDANPGSVDRPFATLERARYAVRELKQPSPEADVTVLIRDGLYELTDTVVFGMKDSSPVGSVTFAAYPGEAPVISGGRLITSWTKLVEYPDYVPEAARGKLWVTKLPDDQGNAPAFLTLYRGMERIARGRGEGFIPTNQPEAWTGEDQTLVHFPPRAVKNWPDIHEAEISARTSAAWEMGILPVASVNEEASILRTAIPSNKLIGQIRHRQTTPDGVWLENTLAVLDAPGEWVYHHSTGRLYYWPESGEPERDIRYPALTELLRVEGDIDYEGPMDTHVHGLTFRSLTFTHADRLPWPKEPHPNVIQHGWEQFDRPTAMVRFRGAENCAVEDCRFLQSGGTGVRLDLHCQNNRISGNLFEHLGGVGILLAGYGPGTKDVNKQNEVANNYVHHIGEIKLDSPAIAVWQSGRNRVANNLVHDTPYTGITVSGRIIFDRSGRGESSATVRWHELPKDITEHTSMSAYERWQRVEPFLHGRKNVVELNEIHNVMTFMDDGNAIYVTGTGGGNVVRENFIHDCLSDHMSSLIPCDDLQYDTLIERNVMIRARGMGTGVTLKGINHVVNNLMIDIRQTYSPGRAYLFLSSYMIDDSRIQRNIFYATEPNATIVTEGALRSFMGGAPLRFADADADRNLYFNTADPDWGKAHLDTYQPQGVEEHSVAADPMFKSLEGRVFDFKAGPPAFRLGIEPINLMDAGLLETSKYK